MCCFTYLPNGPRVERLLTGLKDGMVEAQRGRTTWPKAHSNRIIRPQVHHLLTEDLLYEISLMSLVFKPCVLLANVYHSCSPFIELLSGAQQLVFSCNSVSFFLLEPQLSRESGRSRISREEPTVMCIWACINSGSPVAAWASDLGLVLRPCYRRSVRELLLKNWISIRC